MRLSILFLFTLLISCGDPAGTSNTDAKATDTLPELSEIDPSLIGKEDTIKAKTTYAITSDPAIDRAKLYDEVMTIHDDVMPKMANINKIKATLGSQLKNDKNLDAKTTKVINDLIAKMDEASKSMFGWMNKFKSPEGRLSHEEAMKYLEEEKVKITEVKKLILEAIAEGEAYTNL